MNPTEKRAALIQKAQDIMSKAQGRQLTDDERTELKSVTEEVKGLDRQIELAQADTDLYNQVKGFVRPGADLKSDDEMAKAKSLGEWFVKHAHEKMLMVKGVSGATVTAPEFKAAGDLQTSPADLTALYNTQVDRTIVGMYRRRPFISDLVSAGTLTNANAVTYLVEGIAEGDFGMVAEAGAKPQIHFANPTTRTDAVRKIAAFIKFTDEMIEDWGFLVSEINNRALYMLAMKEEQQVLNGDGTGQNLLGLLNRSGIQTEASASAADNFDALYRAAMKVNTATGADADGIAINPLDYQKLRLAKDANDQYIAGGPFQGQYGNGGIAWQPPVWGLNTLVTPAIAQGTALVAAFRMGKTLYRKGGIRVESTNSHVDDFTNNLVTTRIEERVALADRVPSATVKVSLSAL